MKTIKQRKKKVARVILINDNLEMLLVRQKTRKLWQFPGGIIYESEDPMQAALRELYEETNIRSKRIKLIHTEINLCSSIEETIFCLWGKARATKAMSPDGSEIDKLAWTSMQESSNFPLTDTTKLLLSNISIIGLFV